MHRIGDSFDMRELAERLVAFEAADISPPAVHAAVTCRVCEKLRRPLSDLAGTAGFVSLLSRSLTLAKREASVLSAVQVNPDGSLEGLHGEAAAASSVLIAHLLGLLTTFIGEALTLRLLYSVWPNLPASNLISLGEDSYEPAH